MYHKVFYHHEHYKKQNDADDCPYFFLIHYIKPLKILIKKPATEKKATKP